MSRTPHPGAVSLLRADGMASALLVTLSWFSAIFLAGPMTPTTLATSAAVAVGLVLVSHPGPRSALARLMVLVRRPVPSPAPARLPRSAPPPPRIALLAHQTVRRTRAPGVVRATA